jgi:hypothetical protein
MNKTKKTKKHTGISYKNTGKPKIRTFGIANEVYHLGFRVNKEEGVVDIFTTREEFDNPNLWMLPSTVKSIAKQLLKAAETLEKAGW